MVSCARNAINSAVCLLNKPPIKEGVKNAFSAVTFVLGLLELYDLVQILRGRNPSTESDTNRPPNWMQAANKAVMVMAKISLILSAGVSRPGVFLLSGIARTMMLNSQLERIFGASTIFAVNPWHPRHVVSIAALVLATPAIVQSAFRSADWVRQRFHRPQESSSEPGNRWLTDAKVRLMVGFNAMTSRPVLHMGNHLSRAVLGR